MAIIEVSKRQNQSNAPLSIFSVNTKYAESLCESRVCVNKKFHSVKCGNRCLRGVRCEHIALFLLISWGRGNDTCAGRG